MRPSLNGSGTEHEGMGTVDRRCFHG
jgi:hypothetical protein